MDVLARLMDGVRARGAVFGQAVLDPPWSLRFAVDAPLALVAMLRHRAWLVPGDDHAPVSLGTGDVAVVRGEFTVADDPSTPPRHVVTTSGYCAEGVRPLAARTCGDRPDATALLLGGAYGGGVSARLLRALPQVLVVGGDDRQRPLLDLATGEVTSDVPGQQVVLDRLLDLLLGATLRSWFDRPGARAPAWYRPTGDPVVDRALRLMHDDPAHPWTVAGLASRTGTSRAAFTRRFTAHVGEPPMRYLTGWRIALAADLLRESDATVAAVARQVGYANAFSLSVAFKRINGIPPTQGRPHPTSS
ncbi:AraC family transcriptional regulator [Nonomuraea sp. SYSU D8015]|uniref:AraC family transcriptional regulator n=1 Tax=Nonomuraea sp. SYSU D8015 TaxID=2593644 RepID=UPI001660CBEA|nr:AraC family transcriptional regulator [Nonomuraea sp. SYSU D8015]